jgi:hypothetical protein
MMEPGLSTAGEGDGMRQALGLAAVLAVLTPVIGAAQTSAPAPRSVQAALAGFGMIGTWAADCGLPASVSNQRATFDAPPESDGTLVYDFGPDSNARTYVIHSVEQPSETSLLLHEELPETGDVTDVLVVKSDAKIRNMSVRQPKDGTVFVKDGVITKTGRETQWWELCGR